jgi:hypothetical protein
MDQYHCALWFSALVCHHHHIPSPGRLLLCRFIQAELCSPWTALVYLTI